MTPRLLSALALVTSLSALGLTLFRSEPAETKPVRERPEPPPAPVSYDEELDAKVSALEWVVSALGRRIETVETSISRGGLPAAMPNQPARLSGDVGARVEALQKDVDALFAAGVLDTDHGRERVKEVFREMQDEIATDRFRAREEQREEQRKERFTRFAQGARLTGVQQQRLEGLLDSEVEERRALFEKMQSGSGDRREAFQELRALREKTDTAAREILPGDDYEKYREMRGAETGRGGRARPTEGQGRAGAGREAGEPRQGRGRREGR